MKAHAGAAVLGRRFVPQQFFPSSDRPELLVDLQLPENASIYATRDVSGRFDALLKADPDVDHWSSYVGRGAVRFYRPAAGPGAGHRLQGAEILGYDPDAWNVRYNWMEPGWPLQG